MRLLIVLVPGFGRGVWLAFPDCRAGGPMTSGIAGSDGAGGGPASLPQGLFVLVKLARAGRQAVVVIP